MNRDEMKERMEQIRKEREARYQEMNIDQKLMLNIMMLGRRSHNAVDRKSGQNRVLMLLREQGSMSQRDLTERLGIQPGSVSEILRKLEDAFLIERVPDDSDRRGKLVKLTADGLVLADSLQTRDREENSVFSVLSEEEKSSLLSMMERVNQDWRTRFPMGHGLKPEDFGQGGHGPHFEHEFGPRLFDREEKGDLDRRGSHPFDHELDPRRFDREEKGDLDRRGSHPFDHELDPRRFNRDEKGDLDRIGPGDFERRTNRPHAERMREDFC